VSEACPSGCRPNRGGRGARSDNTGNDEKEDVHTIAVDKNRSKVYYANLLWSLASD